MRLSNTLGVFAKDAISNSGLKHKPLVSALTRVSVPISLRQQRQLAFISEFNIQMLYLPGLKNVVADFLSRPSPPEPTGDIAAAADPVNFEAKAAE
jgi:hypothetical protein